MPSGKSDKSSSQEILSENLKKVDALTKRLMKVLANKKATRPELSGPDHQLYIKAASAYFAEMMSNPAKLIENQVKQFSKSLEFWAAGQASDTKAEPDAKTAGNNTDRRFGNEMWETNPFFSMVKQQYLMSSQAIEDAVSGLDNLDPAEKRQINFFTRQMIDMMAPTNFLATNPDALTKALQTNGQSLVDGLENLVNDMEANDGEVVVRLSDPSAFEVGGNLATTPGSVVFQNRMFQLIQYQPTTEKVHRIPLLIFPSWINKFYILDLREQNSFIKYAVEQGFTVFIVSWINPDADYRDVGLDTYLEEGFFKAIETVKDISDEPQINTIGYCISGTMMATALAVMAKRQDKSIRSSTFFTALTDFDEPGDLSVFLDDNFVQGVEREVAETGFLEGSFMARVFSYLRPNDLVYGPAIRSYLMGEAPPAFDLLFWNSDSTNLPARMAIEFLNKLYLDNQLTEGRFEILGETPRLSDIRTPIYVVAARTDHIAPWKSSFKGLNATRGNRTFILANSGHIAGVVNPPPGKYGHWTNPANPKDVDAWFVGADAHKESWWPNWAKWLAGRSGARIRSKEVASTPDYPVLEPAPGSYVKK